jgi:hypothetical protein
MTASFQAVSGKDPRTAWQSGHEVSKTSGEDGALDNRRAHYSIEMEWETGPEIKQKRLENETTA